MSNYTPRGKYRKLTISRDASRQTLHIFGETLAIHLVHEGFGIMAVANHSLGIRWAEGPQAVRRPTLLARTVWPPKVGAPAASDSSEPPGAEAAALKTVLTLALMLAVATPWLSAAKHPALDPKVDGAKCIECHADKTKGKSVHTAIASGCLSCHEVRVNRDITRIKLITSTPNALCFTCHADKKASEIKGKVHSPAVRDCLTCHDPHVAENKNQLLQPVTGETKKENLCLTCHNTGVDIPKGGSRHAALDSGCDACHVTHKTGDPSQREFAFHLTKDAPALCVDCHDVKDAAMLKAHQNQPIEKADCLQCHDPHQSKSPKLMQAFLHNPFEGKQCDTCHAPAKDGKVVLTQKDVKSLCVMCHEDVTKQIAAAKVQHPGAAGDCTDCHNPHAGKSPGFLQPGPVAACLACHPDQAEQFKKKHLHQPASEQGCATCHEPHGSDNAHSAACEECERALPGVPRARRQPPESGRPALGDDLRRQGDAAGKLL